MGNKVLYPGDYALLVNIQPLAVVSFTLTGEATTLDHWRPPPSREIPDERIPFEEQVPVVD